METKILEVKVPESLKDCDIEVLAVWWDGRKNKSALLKANSLIMEKIADSEKIKNATMCDNCFSEDIDYGRYYRICNNCGRALNTKNVIWG